MMQRVPLTPEQAEAFRAYMHDLNRQAATLEGEDPDTICPRCGGSKAHDETWCPSCTDWQARFDEAPLDDEQSKACAACGYVESETGAALADNSHDNLCCGMNDGTCAYLAQDGRPCATHDTFNALYGITPPPYQDDPSMSPTIERMMDGDR